MGPEQHPPRCISIVIPVHNDPESLARCLEAVTGSGYRDFECVVVDDCSTDGTAATAERFPVLVLRLTGGPYGPAYARNRGADVAQGSILFFVDADVVVRPDTLAKLAGAFSANPAVDAVFGSYDDNPDRTDFLSLYKNLFHHFVHQQAAPEAATFWSGCGAVRRDAFFHVGGFDQERYRRPSIEDIELGYRLRASGRRIMLDKGIQVKHLKRWTMRSLILTDVVGRGIPWTRLILEGHSLPNVLNLALSQRASALLLCMVLVYLGVIAFYHGVVILPLLFGLYLLVAGNWSDQPPHFRLSPRARVGAYTLIGAITLLAVYLDLHRILLPAGILLAGLLADPWWPRSSTAQRRIIFGGIVLGLAATLLLLLHSFSTRIAVPLLLIVGAIMIINVRLYTFFARQRGVLFALAVLPFHLFYYFYSVAAFGLGVAAHIRGGARPGSRMRPSGTTREAGAPLRRTG